MVYKIISLYWHLIISFLILGIKLINLKFWILLRHCTILCTTNRSFLMNWLRSHNWKMTVHVRDQIWAQRAELVRFEDTILHVIQEMKWCILGLKDFDNFKIKIMTWNHVKIIWLIGRKISTIFWKAWKLLLRQACVCVCVCALPCLISPSWIFSRTDYIICVAKCKCRCGHLAQYLLRILRWWQQSVIPSTGPFWAQVIHQEAGWSWLEHTFFQPFSPRTDWG